MRWRKCILDFNVHTPRFEFELIKIRFQNCDLFYFSCCMLWIELHFNSMWVALWIIVITLSTSIFGFIVEF